MVDFFMRTTKIGSWLEQVLMEITIRTMTLDDRNAVVRLFDNLDKYHRENLPWLFRQPGTPPRGDAYFDAIAENEQAEIFVAKTHGIVGFVQVRLFQAPDFPVFVPQLRGLVDNIFVDPSARQAGVASRLLDEAEVWAAERGAVGIDLSVYEFNESARKVFSSKGYSTLSRRMFKPLI